MPTIDEKDTLQAAGFQDEMRHTDLKHVDASAQIEVQCRAQNIGRFEMAMPQQQHQHQTKFHAENLSHRATSFQHRTEYDKTVQTTSEPSELHHETLSRHIAGICAFHTFLVLCIWTYDAHIRRSKEQALQQVEQNSSLWLAQRGGIVALGLGNLQYSLPIVACSFHRCRLCSAPRQSNGASLHTAIEWPGGSKTVRYCPFFETLAKVTGGRTKLGAHLPKTRNLFAHLQNPF